MPNGLLPPARGGRLPDGGVAVGLGPAGPGRGASVTLVAGPAAGVGRGAAGRGADGPRCCAARTAASWSALSWAARASAAATSMSCALVGLVTGEGGAGTGALRGADFLGGAGRAPVVLPMLFSVTGADGADGAEAGDPPSASMVARSRLATGASMVLDADLTNSPISFSLASTV